VPASPGRGLDELVHDVQQLGYLLHLVDDHVSPVGLSVDQISEPLRMPRQLAAELRSQEVHDERVG